MRSTIARDNISQLTELAHVQCGWITQVRWSPTGDMLAIAGADGILLYMDGFGGAPSRKLEGHTEHVKDIAFSPDGKWLASVSEDTTIRLWDLVQNTSRLLAGHDKSVDAVAFSLDGKSVASAGADSTIRLWDVANGDQAKAVLQGHTDAVTSLTYALKGTVLVSGSRDKTVRVWDVSSETAGTLVGEHDDWVREVIVNPPGTMIASAGKDGKVCLWDAYAEECYAVIEAHTGGADSLALSPDNKLLASGGRDHKIRIWSVEKALQTGKLAMTDALLIADGHDKPVLSLAFNATGSLLVSGSGDNTVRLWGIS